MSGIPAQIMAGDHDTDLEVILTAVSTRRKYLATLTLQQINPGDTVRFNDHASPKYLIGALATVSFKTKGKVVVTLNEDVGRFTAGREINTPAAIVDLVVA